MVYAYPEYPWDLSKFTFRGKKSTQRWLYFKLKELLPNVEIIEDYSHPDLAWSMKLKRISLSNSFNIFTIKCIYTEIIRKEQSFYAI